MYYLFLIFIIELRYAAAPLTCHSRIPSATRSSAISSGRQPLLGSHGEPLSGGALGAPRHDVRGERQEGLPSHPPKRTNGADRRSDHSSRFFSHLIPYSDIVYPFFWRYVVSMLNVKKNFGGYYWWWLSVKAKAEKSLPRGHENTHWGHEYILESYYSFEFWKYCFSSLW